MGRYREIEHFEEYVYIYIYTDIFIFISTSTSINRLRLEFLCCKKTEGKTSN